MYTVSVIVPVYNVEKYIEQCIDSVLKQSYSKFELILIDDGSTDLCGKICDDYAEKENRIKVIHQKNDGLSSARNAGMSEATGEYLLFLDGDDFYKNEDVVQTLINNANKYESDLLCFDYVRYIDESGRFTRTVIGNPQKKKMEAQKITELVDANVYQSSSCIKLIRSDLLKKEGIVFRKNVFSEDVEFSGNLLLKAENIYYAPIAGYVYRKREGSITKRISHKNANDLLFSIEQLYALEIPEGKKGVYLGYLAFQYCTLLINWRIAKSPNDEHQFKRIKKMDVLLDYSNYYVVRIVNFTRKILGIKLTSHLLSIFYKITSIKMTTI